MNSNSVLFFWDTRYIFLFLFEEIKLVISNHFGIVRLKTQSEKYMALISKLVFLPKKVIISEKSNHIFVMF